MIAPAAVAARDRTTTLPEHVAVTGDLAGARILVVMPSIPVLGMERANLQIMKMMRDRGAGVLFVVNDIRGEKISREVERLGIRWAAVPVTERPRLPRTAGEAGRLIAAWSTAARAIDRIYREYQPTHIHVTGLAYVIFAAPTLWRARCRVILRQPNVADADLPRRKQALHDTIWRRVVEPLCDVIVCNSRFSYDRLRAMHMNADKLRVIHNCVADFGGALASDAPVLDRTRFNVVFAGQLAPPKGIEILLLAAADLVGEHDIHFHLAGWRSPYAEGLVRDISARGLGDRIHFVGEIDDVAGLLAQADLHVCPSICKDSFPNAVLEAKSCGVPSVVFPSGGLPELVRHGIDGYVCVEKTAAALREGILYYCRDREARRMAGEAARQSLARFAPERISAEWAAVFRTARHFPHAS